MSWLKRVDDPVAVGPHGARGVDAVAVGVGVAGLVEPESAPALAVMRRRQEAIHQLLIGVRPLVGDEGVHLFRRRRQTEQVETEPADQHSSVGLRRRGDPLLFQPGEDEAVDGIAHPGFVFDGRLGGADDRLERPVLAPGDDLVGGGGAPASIHALRTATWTALSGVPLGGIGLTPSAPVTARIMRLLAESPGTTAGPDSPPLRSAGGGVEAEAVAALVGTVALDAVLREDGLHVADVVHGNGGRRLGRQGGEEEGPKRRHACARQGGRAGRGGRIVYSFNDTRIRRGFKENRQDRSRDREGAECGARTSPRSLTVAAPTHGRGSDSAGRGWKSSTTRKIRTVRRGPS